MSAVLKMRKLLMVAKPVEAEGHLSQLPLALLGRQWFADRWRLRNKASPARWLCRLCANWRSGRLEAEC
jgi:hypothetical protein